MKVAITGASGLVGSQLRNLLIQKGIEVFSITRSKPRTEHEIFWDYKNEKFGSLEGLDYIIHLAGDNIASRWTEKKKKEILESRISGTEFLVETINKLKNPPKKVIFASAIGYYGNQSNELHIEETAAGESFLAEVCKLWEQETKNLNSDIPQAIIRIGIVLSKSAGALALMLPAFKLGVAGRLSDGKQYMSWIGLEDLIEIISFLMTSTDTGVFNCVAPNPVTNLEFTKTLSKLLKRPAIIPLPKFAGRLIFGKEFADELLFASNRVIPAKLIEAGYQFKYPILEDCLQNILYNSAK